MVKEIKNVDLKLLCLAKDKEGNYKLGIVQGLTIKELLAKGLDIVTIGEKLSGPSISIRNILLNNFTAVEKSRYLSEIKIGPRLLSWWIEMVNGVSGVDLREDCKNLHGPTFTDEYKEAINNIEHVFMGTLLLEYSEIVKENTQENNFSK
ncbi:MAG: hypothetical protein IJ458_03185 [Clostridia bacterium]|nr:hypothetical protein [Clostridia bacterium]